MSDEEKDSLRSKAYARVLDAICEGPIVGLVDGGRSIYLDETPVKNADGTDNFNGIKWVERRGTIDQAHIDGFEAVETTVSVGVEVVEATPITRTITNSDVDAVLVTLGIPMLQRTDRDDGDIEKTSVNLRIEVQPNGGGWQSANGGTQRWPLSEVDTWELETDSGVTATAAELTVRYTPYSEDYLTQGVQLQRRPVGGSWTAIASFTLHTDNFAVADGTGSGVPTTVSRTVSTTLSPAGQYQFRLVPTGPVSGDIVLTGTYDSAAISVQIKGKTSSRYQRSILVPLPSGGAPWAVRVTRLTDDSDSAYLQNQTWWDTYTEITNQRLRYPHTALMAMTIDSEQFSSVPSRAFDMFLRIVKVPSNYDPITRTYTGSWDGTFQSAWTDNPAWCLYDLLTHPRLGLGQFIGTGEGVDKWALYQIAQYCDELVPNGFGGTEPRFTCNLYLAKREEAYKVVQDIASIFRGMVYWATGSLTATQDSPADPVYLYAPANVIDGVFTYQGSSAKARHTVAMVTWNDPADMCRQKIEYVEDRIGIARFGVIQTEVAAVGCTSRGQAHRAGLWLLYSERAESETVTFKTGLEGAPRRPGQIIAIADPARAGVRLGGRLLAATTTAVTLDAAVTLEAGQTYTMSCLRADGSVQESTVTTAASTTAALSLSPALPEAPAVGSLWILASASVESQLFRVLSVTETERHEFEVTALAHDPSKYAAIEEGLALVPRSVSSLSSRPGTPTNLDITEALYRRGNLLATRLDVSWSPVAGANGYVVIWRRNGTASSEAVTAETSFDIDGAVDGQEYIVTVYARNALGLRSPVPATITHTVVGKLAAPADVTGSAVARSGDNLIFSWRAVADVDADRYEIRRGETWETAIIAASIVHPTNSATVLAPRGGRFLIKAFDTSGNASANAALVDAADATGINVVVTFDDGINDFTGTLQTPNLGYYLIAEEGSWDSMPSWDESESWDTPIYQRCVITNFGYQFGDYTTEAVDIGYVATSLVHLWSWVDSPDTPIAGAEIGADYDVRTSEDGTTWTAWDTFTPGTYRFRYIQIRVGLRLNAQAVSVSYRARLRGLVLSVDVPDRVEHYANQAVPSGGLTLSFTPAFVGVSTVQVTLQSAAVGDTYTVTSKSNTGVTVQVYDSAGAPKAGTVDVDVFGYGERD